MSDRADDLVQKLRQALQEYVDACTDTDARGTVLRFLASLEHVTIDASERLVGRIRHEFSAPKTSVTDALDQTAMHDAMRAVAAVCKAIGRYHVQRHLAVGTSSLYKKTPETPEENRVMVTQVRPRIDPACGALSFANGLVFSPQHSRADLTLKWPGLIGLSHNSGGIWMAYVIKAGRLADWPLFVNAEYEGQRLRRVELRPDYYGRMSELYSLATELEIKCEQEMWVCDSLGTPMRHEAPPEGSSSEIPETMIWEYAWGKVTSGFAQQAHIGPCHVVRVAYV